MYEDCTGEIIAVCVICGIGIFILLGMLAWLCSKNDYQATCGEHANAVIHKYDIMRPEEVTKDTVANFHKELRACFDSNEDYAKYATDWHFMREIEISDIDFKLQSYLYYPYTETLYPYKEDEDEEEF